MMSTNNISPLQELIADVNRFKVWVTNNNSIKSNKSKISQSIYSKAIDAYQHLDVYLLRFRSIKDNEKNENEDNADEDNADDDSLSFDDFMTIDCGWTHYPLFADAIERRYKQIEEFEPHLLTSPASGNKNKNKQSGYVSKKKNTKKKSKTHGGVIGHGGNNEFDVYQMSRRWLYS
eukprot:320410_1